MNARYGSRAILWALLAWIPAAAPLMAAPLVNYENAPVHSMDMSPDGRWLAAVNVPDNSVMLFDLSGGLPVLDSTIRVGHDPVTVRFRNNGEFWAVNLISDGVSVVSVAERRVIASIPTADEPRDVVFAGSPLRAFVSCSQARLIQVFDPETLAPSGEVELDGEQPRSLAVSPDGSRVYAASFESGNRTTILGGGQDGGGTIGFPPNVVNDPEGPYGGVNPPPNKGAGLDPPMNPSLPAPPAVGLIVRKNDAGRWMDDNGGDWTDFVSGPKAERSGRPFGWDLPDHDLAIIDAATLQTRYATGLMNLCMAVAVNPATGRVAVAGTDAMNHIRFEPVVNGRFLRVNVALVDVSTSPAAAAIEDLNPHLAAMDYMVSTVPQALRDESIGDPRCIVWNAAGDKGYVSGLGSNNLIAIGADGRRLPGPPAELGEGPAGIVLDEARGLLYAQNRFEGSISVLRLDTLAERIRVRYYDPTPAAVKTGRKHLYDTHKNSGLGHVACASCHIDGKNDRLAWDLGDPSGLMKSSAFQNKLGGLDGGVEDFHPMKGPMTTQTLQDIIGKEPHHWRGDRDGIEEFNGAFKGLQGDDEDLTPEEMQEFEDFLATIFFPPNPYRNLDNSLPTSLDLEGHYSGGRFDLPLGAPLPPGDAIRGLDRYRNAQFDGQAAIAGTIPGVNGIDCVTCHTLPTGQGANRSAVIGSITFQGLQVSFPEIEPGPKGELHHFLTSFDGSTNKGIKVPQLRNMYKKTGFEMTKPSNRAGFGFIHDGSVDSIARFVEEPIFGLASDQDVSDLVALMLSFAGSDLPHGQASGFVTFGGLELEPAGPLSADAHASLGRRFTVADPAAPPAEIGVLVQEAKEDGAGTNRGIDLAVFAPASGRSWLFNRAANVFRSDRDGETISPAALLAAASAENPLVYESAARNRGARLSIDHDEDGFGNFTEAEVCSDPDDTAMTPATGRPELDAPGWIRFGNFDLLSDAIPTEGAAIKNAGTFDLKFEGFGAALTGADAADFVLNPAGGFSDPVAPGGERGFFVSFVPSSPGSKNATLTIVTNDCDEGVLNIPVTGHAYDGTTPPLAPPGDVIGYLLGRSSDPAGLDINGDGKIDAADAAESARFLP